MVHLHISIGEPIPGQRVIQVNNPETGDGYAVAEHQDPDKFAVLLRVAADQAKRLADEAKAVVVSPDSNTDDDAATE